MVKVIEGYKVVSNNVPREIIYRDSEEDNEEVESGFMYKGRFYSLSNFVSFNSFWSSPNSIGAKLGYHASYAYEGYMVIKLSDCGDCLVVGWLEQVEGA